MSKQTISEEQRRLNQELHQARPDFGSRGGAGNEDIIEVINRYHQLGLIQSVLDYGTGKGAFPKNLHESLPQLLVSGYDPAVDVFNKKPSKAFDLVTCFDVLEHVERESVPAVIGDINDLCKKVVYMQIDLQPAVKKLSTGRNAHIMLAPPDWWVAQVASIFPVQGSFPIYHASGTVQKIAIVAARTYKQSQLVWSMLTKIQKNPTIIKGGYLEVVNTKKTKTPKSKK